MAKIEEILIWGSKALQAAGIEEPGREARSLLSFSTGKNAAFIFAHSELELSDDEAAIFRQAISRRANHEPFQHITGKQEFWGLDFEVSPDVLIPRPETELIVEAALESLPENASVCEVGIGSGCISVAILHHLAFAEAIGLDISEKALRLAKRNAALHGVQARLKLAASDVFEALEDGQFDAVVSNPPYIPAADIGSLQVEVRDYDPGIALTDGFDGLSIIKRIICDSPRLLKRNGLLLIEIGSGQAGAVSEMADKSIWQNASFLSDLQGIPRTLKMFLR